MTNLDLIQRKVFVNVEPTIDTFDVKNRPLQLFIANEIRTSKYNIFTFIPKNLYEQLRRVANLFFLTLIIVQCFPQFATVNPIIAAMPLIIILNLTAIKDGLEDWRRHKSDQTINNQKTHTLKNWENKNLCFHDKHIRKNSRKNSNSNNGKQVAGTVKKRKIEPIDEFQDSGNPAWDETFWKDVNVGDFVKIYNNEGIPADIIILSTSEPDCLCYIETKNLDGETNLKIKNGLFETSYLNTAQDCAELGFTVESEPPSPSLLGYTGTVIFDARNVQLMLEKNQNLSKEMKYAVIKSKKVPVGINGILFRGCMLRNTSWVIGVVVYTGEDTKIMLNSGETPSKRSLVERKINPYVMVNLGFLGIMCMVNAIGNPVWEALYYSSAPLWSDLSFSNEQPNWWLIGFFTFWSAIIAYQNVVPISLYLSVEIMKTIQAFFIHSDAEMYYEPTDQPCIPRSWNLSDDLGQIQYIFSDKTGTLTRNIMEFKQCSINGIVYGSGPAKLTNNSGPFFEAAKKFTHTNQIPRLADIARTLAISIDSEISNSESTLNSNKSTEPTKFYDHNLESEFQRRPGYNNYESVRNFFLCLAICHSVLIEKPDPNEKPNVMKYKAQSPDEAALVVAAKDVGVTFLARENTTLVVDFRGQRLNYKVLNVIEFNSTRKRMSVIVRCPDNSIVLYCKGADSTIMERLAKGQDEHVKQVLVHLESFAEDGLRTLCLASATLSEESYQNWAKDYQEASVSPTDREKKLEMLGEEIETELILLGSSAIEDKLQEGVPECIALLLAAGIKLWVLTGDKMETAINIGFSCNLLTAEMNLILIQGGSDFDGASTIKNLEEALEKYWGEEEEEQRRSIYGKNSNSAEELYALVIDGNALRHALKEEGRELLLSLATRCSAVICCRVSPLQKAKVVELVKNASKAMCLAIGDGANDVSMIQAAHIGIGISGEEGMQAAMASDYSIAQFKYLSRLLLIHGNWSYSRTAEMVLNFLFKNVIWVMVPFLYQFICGFSSEMIFDFSLMLLYNLVFTSIPVVVLGTFDQSLQERYLLILPQLYDYGIQGKAFTTTRFSLYMLEALFESVVSFLIPLFTYSEGYTHRSGRTSDKTELGVVMAFSAIMNATIFVGVNCNTWSAFLVVSMILSNAVLFIWVAGYSLVPDSPLYGINEAVYGSITFYLTTILTIFVSNLPRTVYRYFIRIFKPTDLQLIQEIQKYNLDSELSSITISRNKGSSFQHQKNKKLQKKTTFMIPALSKRPSVATIPLNLTAPSMRASTTSSYHPGLAPIYSTFGLFPHSKSTGNLSYLERDDFLGEEYDDNFKPQQTLVAGRNSMWKKDNRGGDDDTTHKLAVEKFSDKVLRNRGYSFSQSSGVRNIIMGKERGSSDLELGSPVAIEVKKSLLKTQLSAPSLNINK